jgi:hypothetical protein
MNLSREERTELLTLLNVALYDADALIRQSNDGEEIAAYNDHKSIVRTWIHRLSQEPQEPILRDCPHCGGAHYSGQRCPLAPRTIRQALSESPAEFSDAFSEERGEHQDETPPTSGARSIDFHKLLDQ